MEFIYSSIEEKLSGEELKKLKEYVSLKGEIIQGELTGSNPLPFPVPSQFVWDETSDLVKKYQALLFSKTNENSILIELMK